MPLLEGGANGDPSGDTLDEGVVYVYCSITYPFYQAEAYHQFHPNWVLQRDLPAQYLTDAKAAALDRGLTYYTCGEDGVFGAETTNIAIDTGGCINAASTGGAAKKEKSSSKADAKSSTSSGTKNKSGSKLVALVVVAVVLIAFVGLVAAWNKLGCPSSAGSQQYELSTLDKDDDVMIE
jgi:hypothetical protein